MFYTSLSRTSYKYSGTVFPYRRLSCEDIHICNYACRITFLKIPFHYSLTSGSPAIEVRIEIIAATADTETTFIQFTSMTACPTVNMDTATWEKVFKLLIPAQCNHFFVLSLIILSPLLH